MFCGGLDSGVERASLAAVFLEELQGLARRSGLYHVASPGWNDLKTRQDVISVPFRQVNFRREQRYMRESGSLWPVYPEASAIDLMLSGKGRHSQRYS